MTSTYRFKALDPNQSRAWFNYVTTFFDPVNKEFIANVYPDQLLCKEVDPPSTRFTMAKMMHGKISANQNREKVAR